MEKQETRKARFKRVASRRTERILEDFRILGNCSNKSIYEYGDEDLARIFGSLEDQLRAVKAKFRVVKRKKFSL